MFGIYESSRFSLYPGLLVPGLGFTQNSPIVPGSETPRFQVKEILRSPGSRFRNTKESRFQAQENRGLLVPGSGMLRVPGSGIPRLQVREHQGRLYAVEPISWSEYMIVSDRELTIIYLLPNIFEFSVENWILHNSSDQIGSLPSHAF